MRIPFLTCGACALLAVLPVHAATKAEPKAWTDPASALRDDPDFAIQGEYRSTEPGKAMGAQVVALGGGRFDVYILDDGCGCPILSQAG